MKEIAQKKLAIPLLALALVGIGGSVYTLSHSGPLTAHAQSNTAANQQQASPDKGGADDNKQEPNYTSSIRVSESNQEMDGATEAKQLASLAKISPDQAKAVAEQSAGGTASSVKLEEENGNLVYAVTVGTKEVKVDAGNGKVLHTETAEAGENGETGSAESD